MDLTSFHNRVKAGDLDAVRAALEEDTSLLHAKNEAGQSAFLLAKYYGRRETAEFLLGLDPDLDFHTSCVAGRVADVLRQIDREPALLEAYSPDGWTPLHLAAFFGQVELAKALHLRGANVEVRSTNAMKNTPLHAAMAGRQPEMLSWLLEHGADVNARQDGGWTVLHAAAQNGDRGVVEYLILQGADIHAKADNNQTALDLALIKGHQDLALLLEELGAGSK